jgi:hypothetical protein
MARVYIKKQVRLDRLTFKQGQMFKLGNVGVAAMKNRVQAAQGPTDAPAKPLTKRYAIFKTKLGRGNRRNLTLTGDMLRNFQVRTVTDNKARARTSTRKDRIKAWVTSKLEAWIVLSPRNQAAVKKAADMLLKEAAPRLVMQTFLGSSVTMGVRR